MAILVIDAYHTEPLVHALMETFSEEKDFKLVISEVGAIYPREKAEDEEKDNNNEDDDSDDGKEDNGKKSLNCISIEEL
ncbi:MAG: hypothetical protein ACFCU1_13510 [Sumerlaeia bacterium]